MNFEKKKNGLFNASLFLYNFNSLNLDLSEACKMLPQMIKMKKHIHKLTLNFRCKQFENAEKYKSLIREILGMPTLRELKIFGEFSCPRYDLLRVFSEYMIKNRSIKRLELLPLHFIQNLKPFEDFIAENKSLETLILSRLELNSPSFHINLSKNTILKSIILNNINSVTSREGNKLINTLNSMSNLKHIGLNSCPNISSPLLPLTLLSQHHHLTGLTLENMNITDTAIQDLASFIKQPTPPLSFINLRRNALTQEQIKPFLQALRSNQILKILLLDFNQISNEGVKSISDVLQKNSTLRVLSLNENQIGKQGGVWIRELLRSNKGIEVLRLSCNQLGSQGAAAIFQALLVNKSLKVLNLSNNNIGQENVSIFGNGLKKNKSLKYLNVSSNNLNDKEFENLCKSSSQNKLETVLIGMNSLTEKSTNSIKLLLESPSNCQKKRSFFRRKIPKKNYLKNLFVTSSLSSRNEGNIKSYLEKSRILKCTIMNTLNCKQFMKNAFCSKEKPNFNNESEFHKYSNELKLSSLSLS